MSKKFIKMNDNKNNLSLGNLVNIIKNLYEKLHINYMRALPAIII